MNTDKIYAEQLANEYAPKDTSKVVALRKLDAKAKLPASIFTYSFGIAAALVFGTGSASPWGRSAAKQPAPSCWVFSSACWAWSAWASTIPLYRRILKRGKAKYAFEIMELAKEISGQ